jgi:hypothetical protein
MNINTNIFVNNINNINIIDLSRLSQATNYYYLNKIRIISNIKDIMVNTVDSVDTDTDTDTNNYFLIPYMIQDNFKKKYDLIFDFSDDDDDDDDDGDYFQKLLLYFFLQFDNIIISDVDANEFIYKSDIVNRYKKLILIGNALKPDEITQLMVLPKYTIQNGNKSLIIFIVDDIWQLIYFSKRFHEMYEENIFNYDINLIITETYIKTDIKHDNIFYTLPQPIILLINKILGLPDNICVSIIGTTLKNTTKCFLSLLDFYNYDTNFNQFNQFNQYEYIVKLDTTIEKHDIRNKQINMLFYEDNKYEYKYTNHAYVCYLLNILDLYNFPEQEMEFSKRKYEYIEKNIHIDDNDDNDDNKYFKIHSSLLKHKKILHCINNELDDIHDLEQDNKYISLHYAGVQVLRLLSSNTILPL